MRIWRVTTHYDAWALVYCCEQSVCDMPGGMAARVFWPEAQILGSSRTSAPYTSGLYALRCMSVLKAGACGGAALRHRPHDHRKKCLTRSM